MEELPLTGAARAGDAEAYISVDSLAPLIGKVYRTKSALQILYETFLLRSVYMKREREREGMW